MLQGLGKPKNTPGNKRRYIRFKTLGGIRAFASGKKRELQGQSTLINISEGGLQFYSAESVEKDTLLDIHIDILEFHSSIAVGAKVMWAQAATEEPGCYFVGVQFVDLDAQERGLLRRLQTENQPGA